MNQGPGACPPQGLAKEMFRLPPQDMEKLLGDLSTSAADMSAMISTVGGSLLGGIKCQIATLKRQLELEHTPKLEKFRLEGP